MSTEFCPGYMKAVLADDLSALKRRIRTLARQHEVDTLVGTGLSGALIVPVLGRALKLNWAVVRKPAEDSHSAHPFVGTVGDRWLFLDDLIDTGKSLARVCVALTPLPYEPLWVPAMRTTNMFVGVYLYRDSEFYLADDLFIQRKLSQWNALTGGLSNDL